MSTVDRIEKQTLYVERHIEDRFAVVTLNRPDHLNAGSPNLFHELSEVMEGFDGDDVIRTIVLTGGEGKSFSAGADLGDMTFEKMENCYSFVRNCHAAFESIERLPKIVLAAVNGYALGFGLEITLACDLVIASDRARFGLREMNFGLLPEVTLTRGLDIIGRRRAAWLAYTATDLSAEEACEYGLVNKVVPHDRLVPEYESLATSLAKRAPLAVAVCKRLLTKEAGAHYRESENVMPAILASKDVLEGITAFSEHRDPRFVGN